MPKDIFTEAEENITKSSTNFKRAGILLKKIIKAIGSGARTLQENISEKVEYIKDRIDEKKKNKMI